MFIWTMFQVPVDPSERPAERVVPIALLPEPPEPRVRFPFVHRR